MKKLFITSQTLTNALGRGLMATLEALQTGRTGLAPCDFPDVDLNTWTGRVSGLEELSLPAPQQAFDCRNNRLAWLSLQQDDFVDRIQALRRRYGPDRVAVILGTSTSGILSTEQAFKERDPETGALPDWFSFRHSHDIFSVADFVQACFDLSGPAYVVSTACSSSARVFADAARLIETGLCDAAIVGGVDSLCLTTLYGFNSLELVSADICRPADRDRNGLSIGEAGGFAILETAPAADGANIAVLGYGESSDAWHMSTPHPDGIGARSAMAAALRRADLAPDDIDYINLHGTATVTNDGVEDKAVSALFGNRVPGSSTKGWTGHTLGAAGITEIIIGALAIEHGFMPRSLNTVNVDPAFEGSILMENRQGPVHRVLSNSFGFGGNNCSIIIGREVT